MRSVLASNLAMRYEKLAESFLLFIFVGIGGGCAARQNVAPSPHQYAIAEKMVVPGIKDFGKVDEYLYRGAQPKPEGIEELKRLGLASSSICAESGTA